MMEMGVIKSTLVAGCFALVGTAAAAQSPLVVSAGPSESAAWIAAGDLTIAGRQCGANIDVHTSAGAIASLEALHDASGANAAIVQSDVLDYLQSYLGLDPKIAQTVQGLELAAPLFQQELHVVARAGIDDIANLNGARVNMGPLTSGGFLTATIVLDFMSVTPAETQRLDEASALAALKAGELDAVFMVDAAPSRLLEEAGFDFGDVHLLDVEDPFLSEVYRPATIGAGSYDFDPTPASTIAVQSFLMTREAALNSQDCNNIADTVAIITRHRNILATQGHEKWGELDLSGPGIDWPLSPCAVAGLDQPRTLTCR